VTHPGSTSLVTFSLFLFNTGVWVSIVPLGEIKYMAGDWVFLLFLFLAGGEALFWAFFLYLHLSSLHYHHTHQHKRLTTLFSFFSLPFFHRFGLVSV